MDESHYTRLLGLLVDNTERIANALERLVDEDRVSNIFVVSGTAPMDAVRERVTKILKLDAQRDADNTEKHGVEDDR